jgi:hypothetical protein
MKKVCGLATPTASLELRVRPTISLSSDYEALQEITVIPYNERSGLASSTKLC